MPEEDMDPARLGYPGPLFTSSKDIVNLGPIISLIPVAVK
jgi:hypothetical protein